MVILFFGDIFAKPGRDAVAEVLPRLKATYSPDFIIGNVENLAGGRGVSRNSLDDIWELGFSGFTSGNHIWDNKDIYSIFETERCLFRPANYPHSAGIPCPGQGYGILQSGDKKLMVVNLLGRIFMDSVDCPFTCVTNILRQHPEIGSGTSSIPIFVDMHAEASSEKYAMAAHLDGKVLGLVGTHTHVQTADEHLLPKGTAYITDVGMTGSFDSVIGINSNDIVRKFLTRRPYPIQPSAENPGFGCVVIRADAQNKATSILRIRQTLAHFKEHQGSDWPQ